VAERNYHLRLVLLNEFQERVGLLLCTRLFRNGRELALVRTFNQPTVLNLIDGYTLNPIVYNVCFIFVRLIDLELLGADNFKDLLAGLEVHEEATFVQIDGLHCILSLLPA
jgi:hypothetical protein